jgi:uncharacterized protein (TIGR02145 family)
VVECICEVINKIKKSPLMKKYFYFFFLPLVVFLLAFTYLSASEDVILEQEVNEGDLLIYFVNELKEYVHIPSSINFSFVEVSFEDQESTAVLGTDQETIRVDNATSGEVELTASLDVTNFLEDAKWLDGENSYLAYSEDEGISGGLELDPVVSLIETQGCEEEVVSRGSTSRFTPTTSESIDIFTTTGGQYCRYDLTGIDLTQTIPGRTPAGNYSLDMVLTLTGGSKWIPEYTLEYIAGDNGEIIGETNQTVSYSEDGSEVTADPDADYHFLMWSDLREDNPRIDTNVTKDISVEAIFNPDTTIYTVNVYANPELGGTASVDQGGEFTHGQEATVQASSETGYEFIGWSDDSEIVSENSTYVFPVTGNRTLIAEFELEEYELTISSGSGGTTEASPGTYIYTYGQEVTVYALPEAGYVVGEWTGDCSGTGDCTVEMTEDRSVTANFVSSLETLHTISYTSTTGGSVSPSARVVLDGGTSPSPSISTSSGYEFVNFSVVVGSDNGELNSETGEVTNVTGDMTVQANFTSFDPCEGENSVEVDGQSYSLVGIGNQCWMQENLNYAGHASGESWCYENESSYCDTYGRLYNWAAANTACTDNLKLPTDSDWRELEEYLGMSINQSGGLRWRGESEEVGVKVKTSSWNGTNSSGFTALPGGWRYFYDGTGYVWPWYDANEHLVRGKFWSSSELDGITSWYRGLQRDEYGVHRWAQNKGDAYSVRCLYEVEEEGELILPEGYIPVANAQELDNIRYETGNIFGAGTQWEDTYIGGLDKNYMQVADIDLSSYPNWDPLGDNTNRFNGIYDGNYYNITNLTIDRVNNSRQGLFGVISGNAEFHNVILLNADVIGYQDVGGLIGLSINGDHQVISNCYVEGNLFAEDYGGLIIGYGNDYQSLTISNSAAYGTVSINDTSGGVLAGSLSVSSSSKPNKAIIDNCYASGNVQGVGSEGTSLGGFIGVIARGGTERSTITNSFSRANVTTGRSSTIIGGFIGYMESVDAVNIYATGSVTGPSGARGGLIGSAYWTSILGSYFDTESTTRPGAYGNSYELVADETEGKTTTEMKQQATYEDWDFTNIWYIDSNTNDGYPYLLWQLE